jgi:acetylglutamate kinase
VPVIAPIGCSNKEGHIGFNINADLVASKLSVALKAEKVIFMTDTSGVLNKDKKLLPTLTEKEISILKKEGVITSGMIPKVESCLYSVLNGVPKAHIIDGRVEHSILLELLTNTGIGTVVKPIKTS